MWAQSAAEVGKIVAAARRHRGLTQVRLAQAVGTTQTWVSEIEQGKETAQLGKVLRLLTYLGVRLKVGEGPWIKGKAVVAQPAGPSLSDIIESHSAGADSRRKP